MSKQLEIDSVLQSAVRQFRHNNDGTPSLHQPAGEFVFAYDSEIIDDLVDKLKFRAEIEVEREAKLAGALDAALNMIEHSLSGLTNPDTGKPYRKGIDDLALTPDGSMTLLKARAIQARARGETGDGNE